MSKASEIRSGIESATSAAKAERPAEAAGVAGVVAGVADPFAEASQLLVHLVIDKVPPIKQFMDKVTLDEAAADALSRRWSEEFSSAVLEQADALSSARRSLSENWQGEGASKTYQDRQRELEDLAASLASACEGAGYLTSAVNELMSGVREKIIDTIAKLVEMLMQRLVMVAATFWIPIVGEILEAEFIVEGIARTVQTVASITELIQKVEDVLQGVSQVAQSLGEAVGQVGQLSSALGGSIQGAGASALGRQGPTGEVGSTVVGESGQEIPAGFQMVDAPKGIARGPVVGVQSGGAGEDGGRAASAPVGGTASDRGLRSAVGGSGPSGHIHVKTAGRGEAPAGGEAGLSAGTHAQGGGAVARSVPDAPAGPGSPSSDSPTGSGDEAMPNHTQMSVAPVVSRGVTSKPGAGVDTGNGRDRYGKFTGKGGRPGKNAEALGIQTWADANEHKQLFTDQKAASFEPGDAPGRVRYANGDFKKNKDGSDVPHNNTRYYDAIAAREVLDEDNNPVLDDKGNATLRYTGIEVKSGGASLSPEQRTFDNIVNGRGPDVENNQGRPAYVTLGGTYTEGGETKHMSEEQRVPITSVDVVNVPTENKRDGSADASDGAQARPGKKVRR